MEKPKIENPESNDSIHFLRHSEAGYKTYKKILNSNNPQAAVERDEQVLPDLSPENIKFAEEKAEQFFSDLDPKQDILFFVSSDEARALETTNIYRKKAHELGFQIAKAYEDIDSDKPVQKSYQESIVNKIGEGEIRALPTLSLDVKIH